MRAQSLRSMYMTAICQAEILAGIKIWLISDSRVMAPGCLILPIYRNTQLYRRRSGWGESFALPGVGSSRE